MKTILFTLLFTFLLVSCSGKPNDYTQNEVYVEPKYDTTAIDSFKTGAVSVDIAAQIRKSSVTYQDSLKKAAEDLAKKQAEAELQKKEEVAKAKSEKEKKESEKKKEEATAASKTTENTTQSPSN